MDYVVAGASGWPGSSSSAEDIRSQPTSGFTSSGGVVSPMAGLRAGARRGRHERRRERLERLLQLGLGLVGQIARVADRGQDLGVARVHEVVERRDEPLRVLDRVVVQVATRDRVDRGDLPLDRLRLVLGLLQDLDHARAAGQLLLRRLVQLGAELRERLQGAELGQVQAETARHLLHGLDLRVASHAGDRDADVDRGTHAGEEELGLQVDLAVGDRDDVGRDVGRHVAALGLDDRERRERACRRARRRAWRRAPAAGSGGRTRRRGRPRGPAGGAAAARSRGRPRPAWTGRRRSTSALSPWYIQYAPSAAPAYGAMYWNGAGSDAAAITTTV